MDPYLNRDLKKKYILNLWRELIEANFLTRSTPRSEVFGHYNCQVRPSIRPYVRPSSKIKKNTTTSKVNNSAIFQHRPVLRVANERYCYIFFIFRVIWGEGVKG